MSKIIHQEKLKYNNINAYGSIKKDGKKFYGSWVCEVCGQQSGPLNVNDTFDDAFAYLERSFEMHVSRSHKE